MTVRCFLFSELRGAHPSWTLAVMAVSLPDARQYVRSAHGSGKFMRELAPGSTVRASCGATTEAAQAVIREKNRREQEQFDAAWERCKRDHPVASDSKLYDLVRYYL